MSEVLLVTISAAADAIKVVVLRVCRDLANHGCIYVVDSSASASSTAYKLLAAAKLGRLDSFTTTLCEGCFL